MRVQGPDGKIIIFPDGTPPETIKASMARHYGGQNSGNDLTKHAPFPPILDRALSLAPPILATGGAMLGTPLGPAGNLAGAFLGGAIGKGLQGQTTPAERYGEGALQGIYELGGMGLGAAAGKVATGITRRALQPSLGIVEKSPEVAGDVLGAGFQFNRGARGTQGAEVASAQAGAQLEDALRMADARGVRLSAADALGEARTFISKSGAPPSAKRALQAKLTEIHQGLGPRPTPSSLQAAKTYWDDAAASAYGNPDAGLNAKFAKAVAAGMRRQLEKIAGIRSLNSASLRATAASDALSTAVNRNPPPLGASPATWPVLNELVSPRAQGFAARRLARTSGFVRQAPRAAGRLFNSSESDTGR